MADRCRSSPASTAAAAARRTRSPYIDQLLKAAKSKTAKVKIAKVETGEVKTTAKVKTAKVKTAKVKTAKFKTAKLETAKLEASEDKTTAKAKAGQREVSSYIFIIFFCPYHLFLS